MPKIYREGFETFGKFLESVHMYGADGVRDNRLEMVASAGQEEGTPSSGGFAVPVEYSDHLHETIYSTGSILSRCAQWPSTREKFRIPVVDESSRADGSRFGGVTLSFTSEGEALVASRPKFAEREMSRRKLAGLVYVSDEMLADVPTLEATFMRLYGLEGAFVTENAIVNGTGGPGPLGITNANCTIEVAKESGQAGATVVAANVVNMFARLWAPSKSRAVWLVNQDIAPQLYGLTWGSGTGVIPLFRWGDNGEPLLMGRPVLEVEYCPTLGTAGDIILADLEEYLIADPEEFDVAFSGHIRFTNNESAFRVRMRIDGHPAWSSATAPLNGSATVSPFVTLAERA